MTTFELSDQLIERALRSRTSAGADELLVQSILREVGSLRQVRRPWFDPGLGLRRTRWILAAAATLIVVLAALLVLGGGHAPFSVPPSFGPTPGASASGPSPAATAVATGRLVFVRGGDVVMLDLASGTEQVITHVEGAFDPHWAPDGTAVAFRAGGGSVVGADSGQAIRLNIDGTDRIFRPLGTRVIHDTWSPDTIHLTHEVQGTAPADIEVELVILNHLTLLKFLAADETIDVNASTAWSPDGTQFAVVACAPIAACATAGNGSRYTIYEVPIDGTAATVLFTETRAGVDRGYPQVLGWRPDGTEIAFAEVRLSCPAGFECLPTAWKPFLLPAAGGLPTRILADDETVSTMRWSPDGTKVAFTSQRSADASNRIWIADSAFGHLITIHEGTDPIWSPDGRWLAYEAGTRGPLYLQPADGSSPAEQISSTSQGYDWWQPGFGTP